MPKRRWLRYSLRSMLVVVLVLSVWLGWMANQAAKQRKAVATVWSLGGSVVYECEVADDAPAVFFLDDIGGDLQAVPVGPPSEGRLHDLIGHDWFHDVVHVFFASSDVTNKRLAMILDGLPNIVSVDLIYCSVTDAGLEHLASLEQLETVGLHGPTNFTVDGIARLRTKRPDLQVFYPWIERPIEQSAGVPAE